MLNGSLRADSTYPPLPGARLVSGSGDSLDAAALEALRWRPQTSLPDGLTALEAGGGAVEAAHLPDGHEVPPPTGPPTGPQHPTPHPPFARLAAVPLPHPSRPVGKERWLTVAARPAPPRQLHAGPFDPRKAAQEAARKVGARAQLPLPRLFACVVRSTCWPKPGAIQASKGGASSKREGGKGGCTGPILENLAGRTRLKPVTVRVYRVYMFTSLNNALYIRQGLGVFRV